jgi:N-acetylmuramoyl-L-alanine amidase
MVKGSSGLLANLLRPGSLLCVAVLLVRLLFDEGCEDLTITPARQKPKPGPQRTVLIQAGHGNGDTGAPLCPTATKAPGLSCEADINLGDIPLN